MEVGKILLGRHDSVGKSQSNNSGASNAAANYATPPKAISPRPSTDDTSHVLPQRVSDLLNMEAPPFKEKVSPHHALVSIFDLDNKINRSQMLSVYIATNISSLFGWSMICSSSAHQG